MGDVENTGANLKIEKKRFGLKFNYPLRLGLIKFYDWFKNY